MASPFVNGVFVDGPLKGKELLAALNQLGWTITMSTLTSLPYEKGGSTSTRSRHSARPMSLRVCASCASSRSRPYLPVGHSPDAPGLDNMGASNRGSV